MLIALYYSGTFARNSFACISIFSIFIILPVYLIYYYILFEKECVVNNCCFTAHGILCVFAGVAVFKILRNKISHRVFWKQFKKMLMRLKVVTYHDWVLKEALTTSASSPNFFQNSSDFYTIRRIYLYECMLIFTCKFNSVTNIRIFLSSAILKSRLQKILTQWPMGHSGDDVYHKKPHKMKMHWPNQPKILLHKLLKNY